MPETTIEYDGGTIRAALNREDYNDPWELVVSVEPDEGEALTFRLDDEKRDELVGALFPGGWKSVWMRTIRGVYEWFDVLEDWYGGLPGTAQRFIIDAEHSSLLFWILAGNDPLPEPPPLNMSRPWHRLVADGEGRPFSVYFHEAGTFFEDARLNIDQHGWKVLETLGENDWVATYYYKDPEEGYVPHDSRWRVRSTGYDEEWDKHEWLITRIEDEEQS